ncbi:MAG: hypothetical protein IJ002_01985 [Clostridia bacterium]|nr:hypothetical protein [Clostridia bacterium]
MAEFCEKCYEEMFGDLNKKPAKKILSKELELCEGCGEMKHVVVGEKGVYYFMGERFLPRPFVYIHIPLYILWRIILIPYTIYQRKRWEKEDKSK